MSKKTIVAIIALIVVISVVSISALTNFQSPSNSNSNSTTPTINPTNQPTIQPTNQPLVQTYTGYLVSFSYTTSQTNGVESTQLVFTNKTFNYAGYISLDNDCVYNVTYYDNNPNQALNITKIDLTLGLLGNAEQISITNIAFDGTTSIDVMVQNTGSTDASITNAFFNGAAVSATNIYPAPPLQVLKSSSVTITLTVPAMAPGTSCTVKLITAKGTSVVNTATYNP
jgi:hypothetical protein